MSRKILGQYYTPRPLADAIVDFVASRYFATQAPETVLEPSAGGGAFVGAVRAMWPRARVIGVDIDHASPGLKLCDHAIVGDFLTSEIDRVDLCIGNPPYSVQEWRQTDVPDDEELERNIDAYRIVDGRCEKLVTREVCSLHVARCCALSNVAALLLRAAFLHPASRGPLRWNLNCERKIYPRPSFTDDGKTENSEYSLYAFTHGMNEDCGLRWEKSK